jgi:hypothetical protein
LNPYFKARLTILVLATLGCSVAVASDWSERLKPTGELAIEGGDYAEFKLNCKGNMITLTMDEYKQAGQGDPDLLPRENCLSGKLKSAVYHKRSKIDPQSYHTLDDKPYLELFFANLGSIEDDAVPSPLALYTLKLILYDFKGKGIYPIYHLNDTFKPLYDPETPIARTENGTPYLNYNKGRHIPFIMGNFAAMHETQAYTFSTGERLYGYKAFGFGEGSDGAIPVPAGLKRDPQKDFLGYVEITDIGPKGKIKGKYKVRMLDESCSDLLAISHCRLVSSYAEGRFLADPFRLDKKLMQKMMQQEMAPKGSSTILKPRIGLEPIDGQTALKPRLGTQAPTPNSSLIIIDVPGPRKHKGVMGYECGNPVSSACRGADRTFETYLVCMDKNNFKKNKVKDQAKIEQAKQGLRGCAGIYSNYEKEARQCKQLFIDDENCVE